MMVRVRDVRFVIRMRKVGTSESPEAGADPRERRENHEDDCAERKDLNGAIALREASKMHGETPIGEAENAPRDQAGDQQIARRAQKSQHWYRCDQSQSHGRDEVSFQRVTFERRNAVRGVQPDRETQRQCYAGEYTGANTDV